MLVPTHTHTQMYRGGMFFLLSSSESPFTVNLVRKALKLNLSCVRWMHSSWPSIPYIWSPSMMSLRCHSISLTAGLYWTCVVNQVVIEGKPGQVSGSSVAIFEIHISPGFCLGLWLHRYITHTSFLNQKGKMIHTCIPKQRPLVLCFLNSHADTHEHL